MHDYLKVIRLGLGKGEPGKQACWMTALQAHMNGERTDQCECVDPVINFLCIQINDSYGDADAARTEDIMNFGLFRVLGTKGTIEDASRRRAHLSDVHARRWMPIYMRRVHNDPKATALLALLENLPPLVDVATFLAAEMQLIAYAREHFAATYAVWLEDTARVNRDSNARKFNMLGQRALGVSAIIRGLRQELDPVPMTAEETRKFNQEHVFPVLAELIEMGPHGPEETPEPVCGIAKFHELVGVPA